MSPLVIAITVMAFVSGMLAACAQELVWTVVFFLLGSLNLLRATGNGASSVPTPYNVLLTKFTAGMVFGCFFCYLVLYYTGQPQGFRVLTFLSGSVYFFLRVYEDKQLLK